MLVVPRRSKANAVTLVSPENGATESKDFTFKFTMVTADTYQLQVSKTEDFAEIAQVYNNFKFSGDLLCCDYEVKTLGLGTFYWRVRTTQEGYDENFSEVRSFSVDSVPTGSYEPGYEIKKDIDDASYGTVNGATLTNLWVRSVKDEYGNITFENSGQMNRGFTVVGDTVYVSGRDAASSSANTYLRRYSATTGECIGDLALSDAASVAAYPCNDVLRDEVGNVIISNLTSNVNTTPLALFVVDKATGAVTALPKLTYNSSTKMRVDHCSLVGNVTTGNYTVYAPVSSSTTVLQWKVEDGVQTSADALSLAEFAPTTVTTLGTAPRAFAVSDTLFYVKGGGTYFTRYNFDTGNIDGYFTKGHELAPVGLRGNGGDVFELAGKHYMMYPYSDDASTFRYILVQNATDTDFDGFSKMWIFPQQGLGSVYNAIWGAPCVSEAVSPTERRLYLYVPGNGLAAYRLTVNTLLGDVNRDGKVDVSDITTLINMILGMTTVDKEVADVNADGIVDVSDITALINIILSA